MGLSEVQVSAEDSVLVIIDIQKESDNFVRGEEYTEPNPEHENREAIVPTVRRLIDDAKHTGIPVIYVQSVRNHREPDFAVFGRIPILKLGTWHSEYADDIAPTGRDIVVRKFGADPWDETDLEPVLNAFVSDPSKCKVLLTGGSITGCALYGVLGFHVRNYQVVVLMDAVYGPRQEAADYFSRSQFPTFPNIILSRTDLVEFLPADDVTRATGALRTGSPNPGRGQ